MPVIDADAHVVETEHTWDFLDESEQKYRPMLVQSPNDPKTQWWVVDGKIRGFRFPTLTEMQMEEATAKTGRGLVTPHAARQLDDVDLRLKHMDELGIDVQVLHNTIFIDQVSDRPETELALSWAWNRWLADIWRQGNGRLLWSCVPATLSLNHAIEQMRFGKEHGAVALLMRPVEGDRLMFDPYFYPLYEEASRLNLAVAVHIANANPYLANLMATPYDPGAGGVSRFRLWDVGACQGLIMSKLPRLFPNIRWGFIESAAQWVPWVHNECVSRSKAQDIPLPDDFWAEYKVYVTCQNDDDVSYIVKYCGEQSLVIGTDYGHSDPSSDVDAIATFQARTDVEPRLKKKVLEDNPRALYAL
jgi:predicted TIM-barrel fold metal-dependent hydrolase